MAERRGAMAAALGTAAVLLLAGCGNATLTVDEDIAGIHLFIVVQSDSTAITELQPVIKSELSSSGISGSITQGGSPSGSRICSFSVSKDGHSYQVQVYAPSSAASLFTGASFPCSSSNQQEFASAAP